MREILFRGKVVKKQNRYRAGRWVQGYYVPYTYENGEVEHLILKSFHGINGVYMHRYEVELETVSQFTGFYDKLGNKIFEGDILCSRYDDIDPEAVSYELVRWIGNGWYIHEGSPDDDLRQDMLTEYSEVVGNIYENEDLMEVEE